MKTLITGVSGFLGEHIIKVFKSYYIQTFGKTQINNIKVDLSEEVLTLRNHFNLIIHVFSKAHFIPENYTETQTFIILMLLAQLTC